MKLWSRKTPPQPADADAHSAPASSLQQAFRLLKRPPRAVEASALDADPQDLASSPGELQAGLQAPGRRGAAEVEDATLTKAAAEEALQEAASGLPEVAAEQPPAPGPAPGLRMRLKRTPESPDVEAAPKLKEVSDSGTGPAPGGTPGGLLGKLKALANRSSQVPAAEGTPQRATFRGAGAKAPVARNGTDTQFLCTELTAGVQAFWKLTTEGLEPAQQDTVPSALSITAQDHRFTSTTRLRYSGAAAQAQAETGEMVSVVNLSGGPMGAVYATPLDRAQATAWAIKPAAAALSILLAEKLADRTSGATPSSDMIVGFDLELRETGNRLVVLYRLTPDNDLVDVQVSANVENLQFALRQFAAIRRIDPALAEVVLFTAKELAQAGRATPVFLAEPVWQGVPVRKVVAGACAASAALALAATGAAAWEYLEFARATAENARLDATLQAKSAAVARSITAAPTAFARQAGVDTTAALAGAQALWLPGTTLGMDAQAVQGVRYEVHMPLVQGTNSGGRAGLAGALTPERLSGLIDLAAPQGCSRDGTYITANLNEVQVIITCQSARAPLAGYRLD